MGVDTLHLHFRDTRYTVATPDALFETQLAEDVKSATDAQWIHVDDASGIRLGDYVILERLGANEEMCWVMDSDWTTNVIWIKATIDHPAGSYVTRVTNFLHLREKFIELINTAGESVAGRYGPDQTAVIEATAGVGAADVAITFRTPDPPAANYGKLGNMDVLLATAGHQPLSEPFPSGYNPDDDVQGFSWDTDTALFSGGDCDKKYHVTLDFTAEIRDRNNAVVPMTDCRKIYMVFAPRFEQTEPELRDGCFLTSGVGPTDTVWTVGDSSALTGGRYFIGSDTAEERVRLISVNSATQITVERGYQSSTAGIWAAGARLKKVSPVSGFASDVEWGCTISNIQITGDGSLKVGGGDPRIEEADYRVNSVGWNRRVRQRSLPNAIGGGWCRTEVGAQHIAGGTSAGNQRLDLLAVP